jgi:stress-induced morphogen
MNQINSIEANIKEKIGDCKIEIYDESSSHANHFDKISEQIPSHLKIVVISEYFNNMSLLQRHRVINDIMKSYFNEGLHALKIIAKTNQEV